MTKGGYHHGNLRVALIDAGYELARAGGPDAIVLREASRQVGVSHNAAYRHFPDREALMRAVGQRCMGELAALMLEMVAEVDPGDLSVEAANARLRATGTAYVQFALTEPGLFRTGFAAAGAEDHDPAAPPPPGDEPPGPFQILGAQLDGLVAAGGMDPAVRPSAEYAAWSAVHGFSMLCLEGPVGELAEADRRAGLEQVLDTIQEGLMRRS